MGMWVRDIRAVMAGEHNGRMGSRVLPGVAGGQNGLTWSGSPLHPQGTAHQRSPNAPSIPYYTAVFDVPCIFLCNLDRRYT